MPILPAATPLLVALLLDLLFSEPPVAFHPVCWMGHFLSYAGGRLPEPPRRAFWAGAAAWCFGAILCALVGWGIVAVLSLLPAPIASIAEGICLWPLLSVRMLFSEVASVERGLAVSLEQGRSRLSRIVSRDVSALSESQVRESALESLSENLSDSVVAPVLWWCLLGLPGALVYRFANTVDARWGYRGAWEWKGKWAARADDVLNWIPARLTALLLGGLFRMRKLRKEASRTPSPNGGWPMGALALALGVRLSKPGCYVLHPDGRAPDAADTARALRLCGFAAALCFALALVVRGGLLGFL
jgi:adenosylcobinamide-phosphate synthase